MAANNGAAEMVIYKECRRNHAAHLGRYAVDGCVEFLMGGNDGTPEALLCAACGCHRNFHRKEELPLSRQNAARFYLFRQLSAVAAAAPPPQPLPPNNLASDEALGEGAIDEEATGM